MGFWQRIKLIQFVSFFSKRLPDVWIVGLLLLLKLMAFLYETCTVFNFLFLFKLSKNTCEPLKTC